MKVTVALCTYNGEKYLIEQLDSIFNQTCAIDEVIICDDGSTDKTIEIITQYQIHYPSIIHLVKNGENLGYAKNFEKALSLATGDMIFLSDQDDKWLPNKVERFKEIFDTQPKIDGIFCDAFVMNENGEPSGYSIWESIAFKHRIDLQESNELLYDYILKTYNVATGCCIALRSKALHPLLPFNFTYCGIHDEYLALALSAKNSFFALNECLGYYRAHQNQNVGVPSKAQWASIEAMKNSMYQHFFEPTENADAMVRLWMYYNKLVQFSPVCKQQASQIDNAYTHFLKFRSTYLSSIGFFERKRILLSWWRNKLYGTTLLSALKN